MKISFFTILVLLLSIDAFCQEDSLKLCNPGMKWGGITLQSYHVETSYTGGLRKIKQKFFADFVARPDVHDTGYLTLRFMVNCKGEIGIVEVMGSTFDFKEKVFHKNLEGQMVKILFALGNWNPGVTGDGVNIDSQKYLTFIFENGSLKDIVPK